jgi:hypothetical protein
VPGFGRIPVDISFGGGFFAVVQSKSLQLDVRSEKVDALVRAGLAIRRAVNAQVEVQHLGPLRLRNLHDLDASGLHLVDRRGVECRAAVEAIIAELRAMACAVLREGGITDDEIALEVSADMRYAGQGFEIIVPLAPEALQRRDAVRSSTPST